jgi:hypothetical protein
MDTWNEKSTVLENGYTIKSSLHIQPIPIKIPMAFITEVEKPTLNQPKSSFVNTKDHK